MHTAISLLAIISLARLDASSMDRPHATRPLQFKALLQPICLMELAVQGEVANLESALDQ